MKHLFIRTHNGMIYSILGICWVPTIANIVFSVHWRSDKLTLPKQFFLNVDTLCFNGLLCSQYNTFKLFWREHILVINFDFFLYSRQYSNILLLRITRLRLTWRWIENRLYITNAKGEKLHSLFFATLDRSSPITSLINSVQILFSKSGWNN